MDKPLSISDRFVYGAITAFFGAVFGLAASVFLALGLDWNIPFVLIVLVSGAYFFAVGFLRGADAGFFAGETLSGVVGIAGAEMDVLPGEPANSDKPGAWHSPALLVGWLALVFLVAWRG